MEVQIIELFETQGPGAVVSFLKQNQTDLSPAEQVKAFNDAVRHAYWEKKDLPAAVEIGQAGITFAEELVAQHPDQAEEIYARQKTIYYNLASFTWPGWEENGITVTEAQMQIGLEAAQDNLRVAQKLKKAPLSCSRAYWMLAAQELAARQYDNARQNFARAEALARKDERAEGEALLAAGFVLVVGLLQAPGNQTLKARLEEIKQTLRPMDHGKIFIAQIVDALRVFGG